MTSSNSLNNQRTIQSYEGYARQYANAVSQDPSEETKEGVERMKAIIGAGSTILEVGSGPGWDADYVESLDMHVKRTDITKAFRDVQLERGKQIAPLNILSDDLGGPYDGVVALCVLLNIDRDQVESVLTKVAQSLRSGGVFFVSIREGDGELWEKSEHSGEYHVVLWRDEKFKEALANASLSVKWQVRSTDSDGTWLTYLAAKTS